MNKAIGDAINSGFLLTAAAMVWANVVKICRQKMVRGVHWFQTFFNSVWGAFMLCFYYPGLHQPFSTLSESALLVGGLVWVYYAIKFRRN